MGLLGDLGNAFSSGVSAVGAAVETTVDTVVDTATDAVTTVVDAVKSGVDAAADSVGDAANGNEVVGRAADAVAGVVDGALDAAEDVTRDLGNILKDEGHFIGAVLRQDLPGAIQAVGSFAIDVTRFIVDAARIATGGYFVGGIVNRQVARTLKEFVSDLVDKSVADEQRRTAVRAAIGLDGGSFGLSLQARHRICMLDSRTMDVGATPLWKLHQDQKLDLYAMAGLFSIDSFSIDKFPILRGQVVVRCFYLGVELPATRSALAQYIESKGTKGRVRVYALSDAAAADRIRVATEKCRELGVRLRWDTGDNFAVVRNFPKVELNNEDAFSLATLTPEQFLRDTGLRAKPTAGAPQAGPGIGRLTENCILMAVATFHAPPYLDDKEVIKGEYFGITAGRCIVEPGSLVDEGCPKLKLANCPTPDRDDSCCNVINPDQPSGVLYRSCWPETIFRYVLAHEIGHYLGLCHFGHDGLQNVMFSDDSASFSLWNLVAGLWRYYYSSEPFFTQADAQNAWRFIVDQMIIRSRCI